MHRWYEWVRTGKAWPAEQYARAFDPAETEAYGWHTDTTAGGHERIHKDSDRGGSMRTQVLGYPDDDVVIVWANNSTAYNWRRKLNETPTAIVFGFEYFLPPALSEDAGAANFAGIYRSDAGDSLRLTAGPFGLTF